MIKILQTLTGTSLLFCILFGMIPFPHSHLIGALIGIVVGWFSYPILSRDPVQGRYFKLELRWCRKSWWSRMSFQRDAFLDGGSVWYWIGPLAICKQVKWFR